MSSSNGSFIVRPDERGHLSLRKSYIFNKLKSLPPPPAHSSAVDPTGYLLLRHFHPGGDEKHIKWRTSESLQFTYCHLQL